MNEKLSHLYTQAKLELKITELDQDTLRKDREKQIRKLYKKKEGNIPFNIKESMEKIFDRPLTEEEFQKYYPIYTLGLTTGKLVVLAGKEILLKSQIRSLKQIDKKNK